MTTSNRAKIVAILKETRPAPKARICREMESESTPGLFVSLVLLILPVALSNLWDHTS
jgi:hypothetical protein